MFIFFDLAWYFVSTWIGPARFLRTTRINRGEPGWECDDWIRSEIQRRNANNRNALYEIELWSVVGRLVNGNHFLSLLKIYNYLFILKATKAI